MVFNPNYKHDDVSYGTDKTSEELKGPWSHETDMVTMPPDNQPYVVGTMPAALDRTKVKFQIVRFNPKDGVTVPYPFEAAPGEILGELKTAAVPVSDGTGKKSVPIDFNSHQIVLDIDGGYHPLPASAGLLGGPVEKPGYALLLRPDGSVVVHSETEDYANDVRKDIASNYKHEIDMSNKKRKRSTGSGYMGMMGGGMMGGGMMGGGMMGGGMR